MRHKKHTFKIGRSGAHRRAMIGNMLASLFTVENGRIKTTVTKAKELRRWADKMITLAKKGDLSSRRQAIATIRDIDAVRALFDEIAQQYTSRQGGYTRIVRIGNRIGDNAETCFIELVGAVEATATKAEGSEAKYKSLLESAAKVNQTTPEQIGNFFEAYASEGLL